MGFQGIEILNLQRAGLMAGTTNAQLRIIQFLNDNKTNNTMSESTKSTKMQTIDNLVKAKELAEALIFATLQDLEEQYPKIQIDGVDTDIEYLQTLQVKIEGQRFSTKEEPNPEYRNIKSVSLGISVRK